MNRVTHQFPYFIAPMTIIESDLPSRARLVYMALCARAGKESRCWPKQNTIAKDTGLSLSSVKRGLKDLQEAGLVIIEQRFNGFGQTSNNYILPAPAGSSPRTTQVAQEERPMQLKKNGAPAHDGRALNSIQGIVLRENNGSDVLQNQRTGEVEALDYLQAMKDALRATENATESTRTKETWLPDTLHRMKDSGYIQQTLKDAFK